MTQSTLIKKIMNKNIFLFAGFFLLISCVDDYTDANKPHQLDAPWIVLSATSNPDLLVQTIPVNAFQNRQDAFVGYGSVAQFVLNVVSAPGRVSNVSVSVSIPEYGSIAIDEASVNSLKGQTSGNFSFSFTPNPLLAGTADRRFDLVITVSDSQLDTKSGESAPLTSIITVPTTISKSGCLNSAIVPMSYKVVEATGNLDGAVPFTLQDIEDDLGAPVLVTVTRVRPGRYTLNEITGGIWPAFYSGRANPALDINLCGTTISGHEGAVTAGAGTAAARLFTITGTLNNDGTITINWSYVRLSGSTPTNPAMGTYKLAPL
jgi:hypothetical protein